MALFPKIQRPCPVKSTLSKHMTNGVCGLCDREVHDIGLMSDVERRMFLSSCSEEVCVKYTVSQTTKVAAVALSSILMTLPSAAQDSTPLQESICPVESGSNCGDLVMHDDELVMVIVGGIKDPTSITYIDSEEDLAIPMLPVTFEDSD